MAAATGVDISHVCCASVIEGGEAWLRGERQSERTPKRVGFEFRVRY